MNYSKPSVSRAVGILKEEGLIVVDAEGHLELTLEGREKAEDIYERHEVLRRFFSEVPGAAPEIAEEDACKMEHIISIETFEGITKLLKQAASWFFFLL